MLMCLHYTLGIWPLKPEKSWKILLKHIKISVDSGDYRIQALTWNTNLFIFFYCLYIYSYVHTLFGPSLPPTSHYLSLSPPTPLASRQNLFCHLLQFWWKENIRDNKKDIRILLVWDKDSYKERFLALLPRTCALQPTLVHLYQTTSLLLSHLPIMASVSLRLLYLLLYSGLIKHFQVLGFLPSPIPPVHFLSLAYIWPMWNNITEFVLAL
jgi:hypothetical protein